MHMTSAFIRRASVALALAASLASSPALAQIDDEGAVIAKTELRKIYALRPDLQAAFRAADWKAVPSPATRGLDGLEDWARAYGFKEYPEELMWYAPGVVAARTRPKALEPRKAGFTPTLKPGASFDFSTLSAQAVLVVDVASRDVLLSRNAHAPHSMASITKLMTTMLAVERRVPMDKRVAVTEADEVGGARLRVDAGQKLPVRDLFFATLVGSANNASNALARSTGLSRDAFVDAMNAKAKAMGLRETRFADPSGIDVANVSTAEDIAALGLEAFAVDAVRRATTTAQYPITIARRVHKMKNTNDLLTDPDNGLYVMGGKTGYLHESKWNLVVKMRDSRQKTVLVVVLGSENKADSFKDAAAAARWVWDNYRWVPSK